MSKFLSPVLCCLTILLINGLAICQNLDVATIFHNGKIFTADVRGAVVQSVAIRQDKIIATGTLDEVRKKAGKPVKLIDLMGHTMLPGLVDSHNHATGGGRSLMTAHLNDHYINGDSLAAYAKYAISTKRGLRGDVLFIQGFHSNTWKDTRMLESIFDDSSYAGRAVALKGSDGHTAWVNKTMLKRAGISAELIRSLPEADQQYFGMTSSGEPNGLISESGFSLIDKVLPSSAIKSSDALAEAVRHLNMLGITAWMDPSAGNVEDGMTNDMLLAYKDISGRHALTAHVTAVIRGDGNAPVAPQLAVVKNWKEKLANDDNVSVVGFKIFADGVMEFPTQTASMSVPY
ncbi:MAG TPA: amidohydrolase family protein, partial [Chryseolinea sp.]|nr:amidohydrolase family protein [Chryseolinea sp.]